MGVIKQEGIKQSFLTYIGVLIGMINTIYVYPRFFAVEELGLFRFLIDTASLLSPFLGLGIANLSVKMFPTFRNKENGHNGLLFFLFLGAAFGSLLLLLLYWLFKSLLVLQFVDKSQLIADHWGFIIPIASLMIFASVGTQYVLNFKKSAIPAAFNDLYIKVGLAVIAVACYFSLISLTQGVYLLIGIYLVLLLSLLVYIKVIKEWFWKPNWNFLKPALLKEMRVYAFYSLLGNIGSMIATRIDIFMVALLATNDLTDVGIYSIAMFIANIITVPSRSINGIAAPIVSQSSKEGDLENINDIYGKSSIVLLTIGMFFLIGIWCSIDDLFRLMPKGEIFAQGKYVILILGIGKLFDLATGINGSIIAYSKYFRFNFYAVLILAVINVISNILFIPVYQINGAALATMCSLLLFNFSKFLFIYIKLKIQPFSVNTVKILIIGTVVLLIGMWLPALEIPLLDIIIRSIIIAILFIGAVIYFNISSDLTALFWQIIGRIRNRLS